MEQLPVSRQAVQLLQFTSNRKTSVVEFWTSFQTLQQFVNDPNGEQIGDAGPALERVGYAFRKIAQRSIPRRYPSNLEEVWPFLGYHLPILCVDLEVNKNLLCNRAKELGFWGWPSPSDTDYYFVAAQLWIGEGEATEKALFYFSMDYEVNEIMVQLRAYLKVQQYFDPNVECELHVEMNGRKYGPIVSADQWNRYVAMPVNDTRLDLLVVVVADV